MNNKPSLERWTRSGSSGYYSIVFILTLIVVSKATGLLKDVLISFYHGVSVVTDAYFFASSVTSLIYTAISASIPVLVVPLYAKYKKGESEEGESKLSATLVMYLMIALVFSILTSIHADKLLSLVASSLGQETVSLASFYLALMALTFAVSAVASFFNAVLAVDGVAAPSYAVPVVNNVIFCVGIIVFSKPDNFHIVLLLGVFAWLLQAVFSAAISRNRFRFRLPGVPSLFRERKLLLLLMPAVISLYLEQANNFVLVYFAGNLDAGSVSVLGYANKLNLLFLSVFLVYLTTYLFPQISSKASGTDDRELCQLLVRYLRTILLLGVPAVFLMAYFSDEIVTLLFQRGNFGAEESIKVASVFRIIILGLLVTLIRDVLNRVFYAHGDTILPLFLSTLTLAVIISCSYLLHRDFGLPGLADRKSVV